MTDLPFYLQSKISPEPNTGCWLWTGALTAKGYGTVGIPRTGKTTKAHQAVYRFYRGAISAGLQLDHTCRIRCCVNPDHLEPVTSRTNTLRGETIAAKNSLKTICCNGHSLASAYVTRRKNRACRECNRLAQIRYAPKNTARLARKRDEMYQDNIARWNARQIKDDEE